MQGLMQMLVDQERLSNEYSMKLLDQLYASEQADRVDLAESRIVQYVASSCDTLQSMALTAPQEVL